MSGGYLSLRCRLPLPHGAQAQDLLAELLSGRGLLGSQVLCVSPRSCLAMIWADENDEQPIAELAIELERRGAEVIAIEEVEAEDWMASYRRAARPFAIGERLWIVPREELELSAPDGRIALRVEPRMAFGSGSHETTRLVLELLEYMAPLDGCKVLDAGCGSGILGMTACVFGAASCTGFDIDRQAVLVAAETAKLNSHLPLAGHRLVAGSLAAFAGSFDLVVCNIIPLYSKALLPGLFERLRAGGRLLLSGLLVSEEAALISTLLGHGFEMLGGRQIGEWSALVVRRPE